MHADDPAGVVEQRLGDGDAGVHPRAGGRGVLGEEGVEVAAGADQAVVGPAPQLRPVHLDDLAAAEDPQALVPHPAGGGEVSTPRSSQRLDAARGQPVAADLLAGEVGLLQDDDVEARGRQRPGGRRPRRAGAHDDHVGGAPGGACADVVTGPCWPAAGGKPSRVVGATPREVPRAGGTVRT